MPIPLDLAGLARLDQILLGLLPADALPGEPGEVYADEEGTPVARRTDEGIEALRPMAWELPSAVRSDAPVVIPPDGRLPATTLPPDAVLLLPAAGVRLDDSRHLAWARAWTAATARAVRIPVAPAEAAGMAPALVAAYSTAGEHHVPSEPQPASGGCTVLLSGLSGSGKSTIARALVERLAATRTVTLLDGDVVRTHLSKGLGFSREDRDTNVRRIGWVAAEVTKHGGTAVCAPIAPYDETRRWVRSLVEAAGGPGSFVLVWVSTPLEVCEARDVKGLYAKARAGELRGFTGIDDPYEPPADADLVIDAGTVPVADAVAEIVAVLPADAPAAR
jgi:sulfate adenylyltransferase